MDKLEWQEYDGFKKKIRSCSAWLVENCGKGGDAWKLVRIGSAYYIAFFDDDNDYVIATATAFKLKFGI